MIGRGGRWVRGARALLVAAAAVGTASAGLAFQKNPNEHEITPQPNVQDKDDIAKEGSKVWVLDFKFVGPRVITVDVPGRGRKVCWYLRYQVINNTKEPRTFVPDFEIVTGGDSKNAGAVRRDQVLPAVQAAIQKLEDPDNYLKLKNSVTISAEPIPPSKPNAPRPVHGVAIWDDLDPDANYYSIYVGGLSNGWSVTDPSEAGGKPVVRRKTLMLKFQRLGDKYYQKSEEVRFRGSEWVYRASPLSLPALALPPKPAAPGKK
jgi:hypothetical protein